MKTIVRKQSNESLYLFPDDHQIAVGESTTTVSGVDARIICDCDVTNVDVFDVASAPDDWIGGKYLLVQGAWAANPAWPEMPA